MASSRCMARTSFPSPRWVCRRDARRAGIVSRARPRFEIARADDYERALAEEGGVIASFARRRAAILEQLERHAKDLGATLGPERDYGALLDEVTALVEMPTVYAATFEKDFLAVPAECLVLTMRQNQKYFPLFDGEGRLDHRFLIVSNMKLADPANIVQGNERVVRPAARRRALLLRDGPQDAARRPRAPARHAHVPQQARQRPRSRGAHAQAREPHPVDAAARREGAGRTPIAPRSSRRRTW
jgi:hypothetical protein